MENLSDYLYLILVLGLGLLGALRKKKENKTVTQQLPDIEEYQGENDIEGNQFEERDTIEAEDDFWREILVDESKGIEKKPTYFNADNEGTYEEAMATDYSHEGVSALTIESDSMGEIINPKGKDSGNEFLDIPEEESIAGRIAKDFNLNEAIVYSEILNRKENF